MTRRSSSLGLWGALAGLIGGAVALFLVVPRAPIPTAAPSPPPRSRPEAWASAPPLAPGLPPLALHPGEERIFRLTRSRGEVVDLVVDQQGIDVVVSLWSPRGRALLRVDGPNADRGPEPVFAVAEESGTYCLEIEPSRDARRPGFLQVRLERRRPARLVDRRRAAGQQAYFRAEELRQRDLRAALVDYQKALLTFQAIGERQGAGLALYRVGTILARLGDYRPAATALARAVEAFAGQPEEAMAANVLGSVYETLGESDLALDEFHHAEEIARRFNDPVRLAGSLNNRGRLHQARGELREALEAFKGALEEKRAEGDLQGQAVTFNNLAAFYLDVGQGEEARKAAQSVVRIAQGRADRSLEAYGRCNLGRAYQELGDGIAAVRELESALSLARQSGVRDVQVDALVRLGNVHLAAGRLRPAREAYEQALALAQETGSLQLEADASNQLGEVLRREGDLPRALQSLDQAGRLYLRHGDQDSAALALEGRARVLRQGNRLHEAWRTIEEALTVLESMRTRPGSSDLRSSFFASRLSAYDLAIDLLMELDRREPGRGHLSEAFTVSERGRARGVLDDLAEARADVRAGLDPELLREQETLERRLAALEQEPEGPGRDQEMAAVHTQRDTLAGKIREGSPRYALIHPQPLPLAQVQSQVLAEDGTALLAYTLGEESSHLWLIRHDSMMVRELPPRREIEGLAREVHEELSRGARRNRGGLEDALKRLGQVVLGPVAGELRHDRLLVVPDGALQYVAWGALPVGGRFLLLDHEIVNLPSASVLAVLRQQIAGRPSPRKTVMVVADPVFRGDDERFPSSLRRPSSALPAGPLEDVARSARDLGIDGFDRLRYSAVEAQSILRLVPPGMGRGALGFDADRRLVKGAELGDYRIVHFATHAVFDAIHPELSGIVLSLLDRAGRPQEGFLRAYEVYNLRLPVDLVVLSACRTALGPAIRGEGLSGLTRGFMYAGAPRVVVSLWNVSDKGTAHLMELFYDGLLRQHLRAAAALRAAQTKMLADPTWQAPYYWAGFVLEGEWR